MSNEELVAVIQAGEDRVGELWEQVAGLVKRNEPLNNALSLDTPLSDDSDSDTMMEVIADPDGQKSTQSVEETIFRRQLRDALDAALDALPEQYGDVLRLRYYEGQTLAEIAEAQGTTPERVRQKEGKGLRQLRQPKNAAHLRPFIDFDFYCGTGLGAFMHTGSSIQERYSSLRKNARNGTHDAARSAAVRIGKSGSTARSRK